MNVPQLTREVRFELLNTKRRFFPFFIASIVLAAFSGCLSAQTACPNSSTVRFQTSLGGIDVVLTPSVTPLTVANFLTYVCSGAYTAGNLSVNGAQVPYVGTIIHRSLTIAAAVPPYVIQGGGYALNGIIPTLIPFNAAVANEFSISNTRGTIAMAQNSSGINSATNQWYFNTADNSKTLDSQKFTVFGNVANDPSLAVMDAINALPTYGENYGPDADFNKDSSGIGGTLPLINYTCCGHLPTANNFVVVNSIAPIAPVISAAGVADAATAASISKTGISPGEILSLYGLNFGKNPATPSYLGPTQLTTKTETTPGIVDTTLEGTRVLFNGIPGPMIFTSDGQIATVVPYGIANQSTVNVVVSYLGQQTSTMKFNVVPVTPGLFTLNNTGQGDA